MSEFISHSNLTHHDELYQMIVDLHEGCSDEESRKINAKLIFAMMNNIGDYSVISNIIDKIKPAKSTVQT